MFGEALIRSVLPLGWAGVTRSGAVESFHARLPLVATWLPDKKVWFSFACRGG